MRQPHEAPTTAAAAAAASGATSTLQVNGERILPVSIIATVGVGVGVTVHPSASVLSLSFFIALLSLEVSGFDFVLNIRLGFYHRNVIF